ncbi:MAG: hypothetical protein NC401_19290, partial [Ruminococcus sp.]|nr:hypothetical protein [Ruminococcus sp.]
SEPLTNTEDKLLEANEQLEIATVSVNNYDVTVTFRGLSQGDPSSIPSRYADYLINKVVNKYGDPYFVNVSYTGFTKDNVSEWGTYAIISADGSKTYDTIFSFSMSMQLQMGSDEENATIDLEPSEPEGGENQEVTE